MGWTILAAGSNFLLAQGNELDEGASGEPVEMEVELFLERQSGIEDEPNPEDPFLQNDSGETPEISVELPLPNSPSSERGEGKISLNEKELSPIQRELLEIMRSATGPGWQGQAPKLDFSDVPPIRVPTVDQKRFIRGDLNFDGRLDEKDVEAFVQAIKDPESYREKYDLDLKQFLAIADINGDRRVSMYDWEQYKRAIVRARDMFDHVTGFHPGARNQWSAMGPSADSRVIFVSSSEGNDRHQGLRPDQPVKTIRAAMSRLRSGHPDWILLKRGDVWENDSFENWSNSGRSAHEPMVVSSYGDSDQLPQIRMDTGSAITSRARVITHVVFSDLDCISVKGDPNQVDFVRMKREQGIFWMAAGGGITFEGCRFRYFTSGAAFPEVKFSEEFWAKRGRDAPEHPLLQSITFRRCVIRDNHSSSGHAQGIYATGVMNLIIDGCILINNGHNSKAGNNRTIFNHNLYISGKTPGLVVRDSIIIGGASHGIQARAGGRIENNLFYDNALHAWVSNGPAIVRRNVFLNAVNIGKQPRGFGLAMARNRTAVVVDNLFYAPDKAGSGSAFDSSTRSKDIVTNSFFIRNTIIDWKGHNFVLYARTKGGHFTAALNIIASRLETFPLIVLHENNSTASQLSIKGNGYYVTNNLKSNFWRDGNRQMHDIKSWVTQFDGEHAVVADSLQTLKPRTLSEYMHTNTDFTNLPDFYDWLANQHRHTWNTLAAANTINDWIREGFIFKTR